MRTDTNLGNYLGCHSRPTWSVRVGGHRRYGLGPRHPRSVTLRLILGKNARLLRNQHRPVLPRLWSTLLYAVYAMDDGRGVGRHHRGIVWIGQRSGFWHHLFRLYLGARFLTSPPFPRRPSDRFPASTTTHIRRFTLIPKGIAMVNSRTHGLPGFRLASQKV